MKKTLSVRFERSINAETNKPDTLEIVVTPLNSANAPTSDVTLVAEKVAKKIRLANAKNVVTFELTPTFMPGLDRPIQYRIGWRKGFMGRITETDFSMPDRDVDFDDLADLGQIIDGENYLREEDLGVIGRVAKLDNEGRVVDGSGNPIGAVQLDGITAALGQERRDRASEDTRIQRDLTLRLETQVASLSNTLRLSVNAEAAARSSEIAAERTLREAQDSAITSTMTSHYDQNNSRFGGIDAKLALHATTLTKKADLVDGKLATSQVPSLAIGDTLIVGSEAEMLSLTPTQVQRGDIVIRPDGSFRLSGTPIADPANWIKLSSGDGAVNSVNGQVGIIVLGAADVGARSLDMAVPLSDVSGLASALSGKASSASVTNLSGSLTALDTKVTGIDTRLTALNTAAVKTVGGVISSTLLADDIPRVNTDNQLFRKDGTIIPISGGGGAANLVEIEGRPGVFTVGPGGGSGAVASVNGKVGTVVLTPADIGARATNTLVPINQVDGLSTALGSKASTTDLGSTNTRVSRLETKVADLEAGGGGGTGGGGSTKNAVTWVGDTGTAPRLVTIKSPFGINGSGPYYDPEGASEGEAAWPYVGRNGYLELRQLNSGASPEPAPVDPAAFTALQGRVNTLETSEGNKPESGWAKSDLEQPVQSTLDLVNGSTPTSAGDTLVRRNSSGTFAVSEPSGPTHPATKGYADTALGLKADKTTVNALTTTVGTKAAQGDLTALAARVTNAESTLPLKADLDTNNTVVVGQIPTLPGSKVTGFSLKADLDGAGGRLQLSQVPTAIPQANISGLAATLATKADLVGGKLATSQIPAVSLQDPQVVDNRAALLALTSTQVQRGDIAIIRATADKGTYILTTSDPTVWANWQLFESATGNVTSVNGQSGTVVLGAADVNARPTGVAISQADVTNLQTDLAAKAATSYVDTQVATRTTPAAVTSQIAGQGTSRMATDYVATTAVTLSGAQSIDGALRSSGTVLLTAQAASSQNGKWNISTNAWTRATDTPDGGTFMPSTLVVVKSGSSHANSIWQITTATSGQIATAAQNWAKVLQGGPPVVYTAGNGIDVTGTVISARLGSGLIFSGGAIAIDPSSAIRKFEQDVPAGNTIVPITHGLGTRAISVQVYDIASGDLYLVGVTATGLNTCSLEFENAPASGQFHVVIFG